jgi:hypothetical protein
LRERWRLWKTTLDAATASKDENHRLRRESFPDVSPEMPELKVNLAPYEVSLITLEKKSH